MAKAKAPQVKLEASKAETAKGTKAATVENGSSGDKRPDYNPDEQVIKEIMIQKNVSRDEAISILRNPA